MGNLITLAAMGKPALFLQDPGPLAIAHRGGAGECPENTVAAFDHAAELGYRHFETDLHLSADGVVFAFHDARLDRVTNRSGEIRSLTSDQIDGADAGYNFRDGAGRHPFRGAGEAGIPRFSALLQRYPDAKWVIDLKNDDVTGPALEVIANLHAWSRICIGAFSDRRLTTVRQMAPQICTSAGPQEILRLRFPWPGGHGPLHADCIQIPRRRRGIPLAVPALIRRAHAAGLPVHVWTVNDAPTMHRLLEMGIDGILTDRLRLLRDVLEQRGEWRASR